MDKLIAFLAIPLLLVVVLGSALAMWYDTLKIHATINSGDVDVHFGNQVRAAEEDHGKSWVANCSAQLIEISDEDHENPFGNNDIDVKVVIVNGYPSYMCKVQDLQVYNSGTIPVKFLVSSVTAKIADSPRSYECDKKVDEEGKTIFECDVDHDGDYDVNLWGCFTTLEGFQLEPGNWTSLTFESHIKQGAPESVTIEIQVHIRAIQWNEYQGVS